jgi:hypothetical protein
MFVPTLLPKCRWIRSILSSSPVAVSLFYIAACSLKFVHMRKGILNFHWKSHTHILFHENLFWFWNLFIFTLFLTTHYSHLHLNIGIYFYSVVFLLPLPHFITFNLFYIFLSLFLLCYIFCFILLTFCSLLFFFLSHTFYSFSLSL